MKYFPPNKIWFAFLSTPLFSPYLYAESSESISTLATIIVEAEDNDESTEKNIRKVIPPKQQK